MPKNKQQKSQDLEELKSRLSTAKSVVFSEYRGSTVKSIDKVRRSLEAESIKAKVYKLTLLHKALEEAGVKANTAYGVPVLVAFSEVDDVAPARLLKKFVKEVPTVSILGGVVSGQYYDKSQMLALADLPSKPEMLAKLVGTIQAPVSSFVNVLAGNIRGLVNVLNAIATK